MPVSDELIDVLRQYELWQQRSQGACSAQLGGLIRVWQAAEKDGQEPNPAELSQIVREIGRPGWEINEFQRTVTRLTSQALNLNSIAKGYIIQKAVAATRERIPELAGILLNLGGDMHAWIDPSASLPAWRIGVQNPAQPADNSAPLTSLTLKNLSVATSGSYQRYFRIGDRQYSHLLNPRTGQPAQSIVGATVLARDNVTANVLATTLCVLSPAEGLKLVATTAGAACLLITHDGQQIRSPGFGNFEVPVQEVPDQKVPVYFADATTKDAWPEDYRVSVHLELPKVGGGKSRRPYVAIWVEDDKGKAVRSLVVWGTQPRYWPALTNWWKLGKGNADLIKAVTRATRGPGKYEVVWDGKDDAGKPVSQGTYTVRVEVNREHGKHTTQNGKIQCGAEAAKTTADKNAETEETTIEYGKKK
jgi:thiamine biosynthesis lipoprotein ApbE